VSSIDGPLSSDTASYGYDERGRVVTRTLNGVTTTWSYDVLGRLTTLTDPVGNFTHSYLGMTARLGSLTYPNGQQTTYVHLPNSGDRRLQEIHHRASASGTTLSRLTYGYDAAGNITLWTQQYGTAAANAYDFKYDATNELESAVYRTTDAAPVVLKRYGYAYDPVGNRTTEQIDDAPTLSSYDNRNRLTSQQPGGALLFKGGLNEAATVTIAGKPASVGTDNKFQETAPVGSGTSTVAVAATDPSGNLRTNTYQVTTSGSTKAFTYDANGSVVTEGSRSYEWDGANRLVRVLDNAVETARFVYDGQGRRSQKIAGGVTRTYVYDGSDILEERLSTGTTIRYVHGPGTDQPMAHIQSGAVTYYLADHLGSILQTTDGSAAVTLTRQYDPWGNLLQGSGAAGYAFTGRELDPETGLYYYRARYLDQRLGRFTSEDVIGFEDGVNLYAYAGNNAVLYSDPSGLFKIKNCDKKCISVNNDPPEPAPEVIRRETEEWCNNLQRITDPKLRSCIQKSCDKGTVQCGGRWCGKNGGYNIRFLWTTRTAHLCLQNWPPSVAPGSAGETAIHEWAHGCGWKHFGGGGVPGNEG
jgi:RHS repeat-associated protein